MPKPISFAYIAGFFDGEGHVCLRSSTCNRVIGMTQGIKQRAVLFQLQRFLAQHEIASQIHRPRPRGGRLRVYQLVITHTEDMTRFLRAVLPYLIVKHKKAVRALKEAEAICARRRWYATTINDCVRAYKRGVSLHALATQFGIARQHLRDHLKKRGVQLRTLGEAQRAFEQTVTPTYAAARRRAACKGARVRWAA